MLFQILMMFITHLILPGYVIYYIWSLNPDSKYQWLLRVLTYSFVMIFIFLIGNWVWLTYYLRFVLLAMFGAAVFVSYKRIQAKPFFPGEGGNQWLKPRGALLELVFALGFLAFVLRGFFYTEPPVHLTFPLQDGRYYMYQAGNNPLLNYHNAASQSQRYALDIVAINAFGQRANGLYPTELERYVIFGKTIYSPCDGTVVEAVDGLSDYIPPEADTENPAGNHVAIACMNVEVVLAHMQNGSVLVEQGDSVATGEPLGLVGNSGNTSEPHLHIHASNAESSGVGVPILFDGNFPVRNTVYVR